MEPGDLERLLAAIDEVSNVQSRSIGRSLARLRRMGKAGGELGDIEQLATFLVDHGFKQGREIAAGLTAQWYDTVRYKDTGREDGFEAQLPDFGDDTPYFRSVADTLLSQSGDAGDPQMPANAREILGKIFSQYLREASRATVAGNVKIDPAKPKWAMVPSGAKTCAFCAARAGRGWQEPAQADTAPEKSHANCDCLIVPAWAEKHVRMAGYEPDLYKSMYDAAAQLLKDSGEPFETKDVFYVMRRMFPTKLSDSVRVLADDTIKALKKAGNDDKKLLAVWRTAKPAAGLHADPVHAEPGDLIHPEWRREYSLYRQMSMAFLGYPAPPKVGVRLLPPKNPVEAPADWPKYRDNGKPFPRLTRDRLAHILYGDFNRHDNKCAGGHAHGYGWRSGGSPFPKDWGPDDICEAIRSIIGAQKPEKELQHELFGTYKGLRIQIIFEGSGSDLHVVTAFPPEKKEKKVK